MAGRLACIGLFLAASACSHAAPPPLLGGTVRERLQVSLPHPEQENRDRRGRVVTRARELVNGAPFTAGELSFSSDPVGFARASFWAADIDLFDADIASDPEAHGVEILFRSAAARDGLHKHTPRPGDLVFLDADGRGSALYPTAVAVVEEALEDGTLLVLGVFADGPARITMNLRAPDRVRRDDGVVVNDLVGSGVAVAQLFRSFADPF
jgi:hypothetical protein